MGVVVKPGHKEGAVDAHSPVYNKHFLNIAEKGPGGRLVVSGLLGFNELLGLGEQDSDETDADGETSYVTVS
jgi:hypothetical protein